MRWISAGVAYLLFLQSLPLPAAQETQPTRLNLIVIEGEGAINNIRQRTARAPIVQVEDQNHRPIAGAAVVFTLPEHGASGVFHQHPYLRVQRSLFRGKHRCCPPLVHADHGAPLLRNP